jgi:TonB family protein
MKFLFIISCFCCQIIFAQNKLQTTENIEAEKKQKIKQIRKELLKKKLLIGTKNPLYIINGTARSSIKAIDTLYIDNITALLPKAALKKYGAIGKNGVLEITKNESFQGLKTVETIYPPVKVKGDDDELIKNQVVSSKTSFSGFLQHHLEYPSQAQIDSSISGQVIIRFVVEKDGSVTNVLMDESSPSKNISLVNEAIRVIKKTSGFWNPSIEDGVRKSSINSQAINFVLPKD